ncbi:unnamed protein product, partial [Staurois parvus]
MRCPWYPFHRLFFFEIWARTQGPHDPLLPGGPMSCQSAPDSRVCKLYAIFLIMAIWVISVIIIFKKE